MRTNDIRLLYDYNAWANARIIAAAAQVPAGQFTTASLGACNLRDTLIHIMIAESIWRLRWQSIAPESVDFPDDFPTLDSVCERWRIEDRELDAFLATLDDAGLAHVMTFRRKDGATISQPLWHTLVHVVNHGTQHRAELALLLTELGHSPGDIDLTVFLRERAGAPPAR